MTSDVFTEDDLLGRRELSLGRTTPAPQTATVSAPALLAPGYEATSKAISLIYFCFPYKYLSSLLLSLAIIIKRKFIVQVETGKYLYLKQRLLSERF